MVRVDIALALRDWFYYGWVDLFNKYDPHSYYPQVPKEYPDQDTYLPCTIACIILLKNTMSRMKNFLG